MKSKLIIMSDEELKAILNDLHDRVKKEISNSQTSKKEEKANYLTRREAAKCLNISLPTLSKYIKSGYISAYRIGNRILLKEEDINSIKAIKVKPFNRK